MVQWGKSTEWLLKFHPDRDHATRKIISGRQISLHFPRIRIFVLRKSQDYDALFDQACTFEHSLKRLDDLNIPSRMIISANCYVLIVEHFLFLFYVNQTFTFCASLITKLYPFFYNENYFYNFSYTYSINLTKHVIHLHLNVLHPGGAIISNYCQRLEINVI